MNFLNYFECLHDHNLSTICITKISHTHFRSFKKGQIITLQTSGEGDFKRIQFQFLSMCFNASPSLHRRCSTESYFCIARQILQHRIKQQLYRKQTTIYPLLPRQMKWLAAYFKSQSNSFVTELAQGQGGCATHFPPVTSTCGGSQVLAEQENLEALYVGQCSVCL